MIAQLRGNLISKSPTDIVVDVYGVGYQLTIPVSTYQRLPDIGSEIALLTHLHVREDAILLFGFFTEAERSMFRLLISVSGIGPKIACGILSGVGVDDLRDHILHANTSALTTIPGIGRKTAERLVVELRDKLGKDEFVSTQIPAIADHAAHVRSETLLALIALGLPRATAEKAIRQVSAEIDQSTITVEELIKKALRHTS